jgi:dihydrolipoamide dehydrogenase
MSEITTDLAILGAGPGGYVAAIRAAQLGLKVTIIEKDKLGGVCLNIGCIPSKALIHQAEVFTHAQEAESLGIKLDLSGFDYSKVFKKSRSAADRLSKGVGFLMKKNEIQVLSGTGTILEPGLIEVNGPKDETSTVKAKDIIIATGSRPRSIPGFDFDEETVLSSNGALMLKELPKRLVILGAGAIGCEFAHIMNSFGTKVTLVEMLDQILPIEDPEASKVLAEDFKKRKIDIHVKTRALGFKKTKDGLSVELEGPDEKKSSVSTDKLLVVVGRIPNTEGIGLENLGITTDKGFIPVEDYCQTSVPHVYAIGDVVATPLLAHVASKEGEIAVEHIAGHSTTTRIDLTLIPSAVYTEPEIASFGLTKEKAIMKGFAAEAAIFPYRGSGKAVATDAAEGIVKIVYDTESKEILGAHIAGSRATEILHEVLLASASELLPEDIASMIHAHPTLSETVMESMKLIQGAAVHI